MTLIQKLKNKKKFVPQFSSEDFPDEFESLIQQADTSRVKEGSVVKGTVVGIEEDTVIVDVGLKNEGRISISEFKLVVDHALPNIGELVDVYVERLEGRNGRTILSREKAIREESWSLLEQAYEKEELVDGVIFGRVKGGFTVDLSGVVAFLPGSQVDIRPIKDVSPLMDIVQPFKILKMDKKLGNIVVSRRVILEESHSGAREEMLSQIREGIILDGIVKNITDYGAFVDLGSVDGLLHVTDVSWSRINHPSEVFHIGQKIKVIVIKFNEETKRISLGMKQLDQNPWLGIKEEFPVRKVMSGKITNVTEYGAFIEIKNGIEGLVHSSEISWVKANQSAKRSLTIGQTVQFMILEIDEEKHRISLSIKQCHPNPWQQFAATHHIGDIITASVRNVADFGLFVAIGDEIDGMIHESDIAWHHEGVEKLKTYKKGDTIECKILNIDVEKERVSLGVKQLENQSSDATEKSVESALQKYGKNTVVTAEVIQISGDCIEVRVAEEVFGTIKRTDLSSEKSEQNTENFVVGGKIQAVVVNLDKNTKKLNLSIKAYENAEREKTMKEYSSAESVSSLGQILGAAINQAQENK